MFDIERFVEDCRGALAEGPTAVREIVARAVAEPGGVTAALRLISRCSTSPGARA